MSEQTETAKAQTVVEYIHGKTTRLSGYIFAVTLLLVGLLFILQNIWLAIPALLSMYVFGMTGASVLATGFVKRQLDKSAAVSEDG